ncbi:MAG: NAD(P)-dependent alcohol dehydrogenase [Gammaproteobacteria bacterium]|nr:NAD(P)-dependent alcohol dehydrogenase [Gammaproteobacteria bacterium]
MSLSMQAMVCTAYGAPEVLKRQTVPVPIPEINQVVIKVHVAAINPGDIYTRNGEMRIFFGLLKPRTAIFGYEFCGEIVALGEQVNDLKIGDRVCALIDKKQNGAYAQYAFAPASHVVKLSDTTDDLNAAALILGGITAIQALRDCAQAQAGMRVLITGAAGSVGYMAAQIARLQGLEVVCIANERGLHSVKALGFADVYDYKKITADSFTEPFDIILDSSSMLTFTEWQKRLKPNGVFVTTGPRLRNLWPILRDFKKTAGQRAKFVMGHADKTDMTQLVRWFENKQLQVLIDKVFSVTDVVSAHHYFEKNAKHGKILLKVLDSF